MQKLIPDDKVTSWVEVILPLALPHVYTYHVPQHLNNQIKKGCRVEVIFGKQKRYAGIIRRITDKLPAYPTKPVLQVLDETPLVFDLQLDLWEWMAAYYMCSEGEVMAAALPAHFKLSSESILVYNEEAGEDFSALNHNEYLVAEALLIRKQLSLSEVQMILDAAHVYPVVKKLIDYKICIIWEKFAEKFKPRKEKFVTLLPQWRDENSLQSLLNDWTRAPKQLDLLLSFLQLEKNEGTVTQSALLKLSGASTAQLQGLIQKNILEVSVRSIDRIQTMPRVLNMPESISEAQLKALDEIRTIFDTKNVCLLHGVTGSGKTIVYVKLIEEVLKLGQQVIFLVPEIALTAQLIRRLQVFFGGYIGVYHSKFNDQERVELWNKVRSGETRIVLGARSALLLPFLNPGLIIVDEEHDASYKQQEPAPRYHARDTAVFFGHLTGAKVLLGSATPSFESYFNAVNGKYGYVQLTERYGNICLPEVEIVKQYFTKGEKPVISDALHEAITQTVSSGKQVILFQNRRGYNPYIICGDCGFIPKCEHCDVSLTVHKFSNKLHCHYCGSSYPKLIRCIACGAQNWQERNFGTEKAEESLEKKFPDLRIARMDMDSVRGKMAHDNLVKLFEQQKLDLLIGTQMVVKGLDFDHVGLVGILDADGILGFADFRVNERAFQLMEQVSGRAGRKNNPGKVIIQAINHKHPVLLFVQQHDYKGLYDTSIEERKVFDYPPFARIIMLTLKHTQKDKVEQAASRLAELLKKDMPITGPAQPYIGRLRNKYLMEIMTKFPKDKSGTVLKRLILNAIALLHSDKQFSAVQVIADVDPV